MVKPIKSPCIGVCSTGIGDSVCRGCKRYSHEIITWNAYSQDEKRAIAQRLEGLLSQVVQSKVLINDKHLLRRQLSVQQVSIREEANPHCWVFDLLKAGARQLDSLQSFGCSVLDEFAGRPLTELRDAIDNDFYILSTVHYERYFQINEI